MLFFSDYHQGDKKLPIFQKLKSYKKETAAETQANVEKTVQLLTTNHPHPALVCSIPPRRPMKNLSFVVDTSKFEDEETRDLLADDCGGWLNYGQHTFDYCLDQHGQYVRVGKGGGIQLKEKFSRSGFSVPDF